MQVACDAEFQGLVATLQPGHCWGGGMMLPSLPRKMVILHSLLTDLLRKAPRAVFRLLTGFFFVICMCCMLC